MPSPKPDSKLTFTEWGIRYPWHISGTHRKYPRDQKGNCACKCKHCRRRGVHKATKAAHLKV